MRHRLTPALMLLATTAQADGHNTPTPMKQICNENGAIIQVTGGNTYYLGNSCDAARKGGGTGKWWYAAAAFLVEIDGKTVRFANNMTCKITYCTFK